MPDFKGKIERENFSVSLLRLYLYYRFVLSVALLLAFYTHIPNDLFGFRAPELYVSANILFVVITAITLGFYQLQRGHLSQLQLFLSLVADIAVLTVLMFCSDSLNSGIGYLLLITVAAGAIFFTGQMAVLIPAVASICIILESVLSTILYDRNNLTVFPAGVLGVFLFLTSLIFSSLSRALMAAQETIKSESRISAGLQELNQLIIERMRTGILVVDDSAIIHQVNTAARELLGRQGNGLQIGESLASEDSLLDRLARWGRAPGIKPAPFTPGHGGADLQPNFAALDISGLNRTIIFLEDLRTQTQQAQQLKLASLGRLTGSIAHEIRNPLGAISHASELLSEQKEEDVTARRLTEIINTHVKRVNHIVENVMQLSKRQDHKPEKLELARWLPEFLDHYKQGTRIAPEIELTLPEDDGVVIFDPIHLQRVLTNLLDNAVRFSHQETGTPWAGIFVSCRPGTNIITLDLCDKGPGVAEEDRNQLFEPFFSKSPGGSGLGLYIARELCAINFTTLKYIPPASGARGEGNSGCFRMVFAHPDKVLKLSEEPHERQQGTDHRR